MGRFDFVSPAAAVSDSLTKMLAERKAEQRQQLLDQLSMHADERAEEASQREIADQQLRQQSMADELKSRALDRENTQQQLDLRNLGAATEHMRMGNDVSKLDPTLLALGRRYGVFTHMDAPPVGMMTGADLPSGKTEAPPPTDTYIGTPQEQEKKARMDRAGGMILGMLTSKDPNTQATGQSFQQAMNLYNDIPEGMQRYLEPEKKVPLYTISPEGVATQHGAIPQGAIVKDMPREPKPMPWAPAGINGVGDIVLYNAGTGDTKILPGVNKPNNKQTSIESLGIPTDAAREVSMLVRNAINNLSSDDNGRMTVADDESLRNYRIGVRQAISRSKLPPKLQTILQSAANKPSDLLQILARTPLTPDEKQKLMAAYSAMVPEELRPALEANPIGQ